MRSWLRRGCNFQSAGKNKHVNIKMLILNLYLKQTISEMTTNKYDYNNIDNNDFETEISGVAITLRECIVS